MARLVRTMRSTIGPYVENRVTHAARSPRMTLAISSLSGFICSLNKLPQNASARHRLAWPPVVSARKRMRSYEKSPGGSNRMGAPVRVGEVVAEKFEVTKELGNGGMGVVFAARHRVLDRLVALKFMHAELSTNAQATERFLAEARAAARLKNEHVGRILDADRLPNGVPYIVMEYLEGKDPGRV